MPSSSVPRLCDRFPLVARERLVAELVPPPRFSAERFSTYRPDPAQPTQAAAVARLAEFAAELSTPQPSGRWFRRSTATTGAAGRYLDGGFGVGKTHLLASLWHEAPAPKSFATFVAMTDLVGAIGFAGTVDALSGHRLLCIDEFELDDPGDTVLMSTLLARLVEAGVRLAATSNTLPDALGEGRFAADDFVREIQGLANSFEVVRVDGEDYRHRGLPAAPVPADDVEVRRRAHASDGATLDDFRDLLDHLKQVHPSRYGALLDGVTGAFWTDVHTVSDQAAALRLVALADRLYDRAVPLVAGGAPLDRVFAPELLRGGYRKKYFRARSRLVALAREGVPG